MSESGGQAQPTDGQRPTVLVVEDEILIRLLITDDLRAAGYNVLEAANSAEALAYIAAGCRIDLVVTDVRMPGDMDGVALTRELKKLHPLIRVAIVSGHLIYDAEHGADGFLAKPYTSAQLLSLVRQLTDHVWQTKPGNSKAS